MQQHGWTQDHHIKQMRTNSDIGSLLSTLSMNSPPILRPRTKSSRRGFDFIQQTHWMSPSSQAASLRRYKDKYAMGTAEPAEKDKGALSPGRTWFSFRLFLYLPTSICHSHCFCHPVFFLFSTKWILLFYFLLSLSSSVICSETSFGVCPLFFLIYFIFFVFLSFLGPHPPHMEVPRLEVRSEL